VAGAVFCLLYAATAAPSLVSLFDDSLEFQLVLPTFALAHPTGYPLYTILGGLWSRVIFPVGNWAWRANLFSALAAGATIGLVFALAQRLVTGGRPYSQAADGQSAADLPTPGAAASEGGTGATASESGTDGAASGHVTDGAARLYGEYLGIAAGAAAALVFGLGPVWSAQATLAEVYALHNLLLAAALLVTLAVPRRRPPEVAGEEAAADRRTVRLIALLALLLGLGFAHHRTIVLAVPGIAVYLAWSVPGLWRPRRAWLLWLAALLAPLLLYLYLPLRAAAGAVDLHGSYTNTWTGFWDHVLARGYTGFFTASPLAVERSPGQWFELFLAQTGFVGLALAAIGGAWVWLPLAPAGERRRPYFDGWRKGWLLILLVLLANLVFALLYRVADQEVFLLPVFLCLALLAGGGVAATGSVILRAGVARRRADLAAPGGTARPRADLAAPGGGARPRAGVQGNRLAAMLLLVLVAALLLLVWNPGRGPFADRRGEWAAHDYAVDMAKVPFPPGSTVIGLEGEVTALKYMQAAEGLGTAAVGVAADDPIRRGETLAAAVAAGLPAYLTRELAGIAGEYSFGGDGPLVRVWPRGEAEAGAPAHRLDLPMDGGRLVLQGTDLQRLEWAGGPALRANLYWQPVAELPRPLKVSLRLLGPDGAPLAYADGAPATLDAFPLRGVAPTTTWVPGETVRDVYTLYLPPAASQGATIQVILYDAETIAEVGRFETPLPIP
jgi:hypothetical protein